MNMPHIDIVPVILKRRPLIFLKYLETAPAIDSSDGDRSGVCFHGYARAMPSGCGRAPPIPLEAVAMARSSAAVVGSAASYFRLLEARRPAVS